jgi:hypothetical protein
VCDTCTLNDVGLRRQPVKAFSSQVVTDGAKADVLSRRECSNLNHVNAAVSRSLNERLNNNNKSCFGGSDYHWNVY